MDDVIDPRLQHALRSAISQAVNEALAGNLGNWGASNKLVLRINEVADLIGLSPSTIRNFLDSEGPWFSPEFPKPIRLGGGTGGRSAIGWRRTDIVAWVDSRPTHEMSHQVHKKSSEPIPLSGRRK